MVVGYSLGRAFIYSTPEYAVIKLPFQILQAAVGAVLGMLIVWRFGVGDLFRGKGITPPLPVKEEKKEEISK